MARRSSIIATSSRSCAHRVGTKPIVTVPYDKDTKILSLHVWSVAPDGHEYSLKENEIADFGYPGSGSFVR